jgi:flavin-dependent dehydrogenase
VALFDPIKTLCAKFAADAGWKALFAKHGLNLAAANLAAGLQKPLTIDRTLLGFGDFADDATRAIEPGSPSRSLLYHALASPNVLNAPDGTPLTLFPGPAELDAVENYIFGVNTPKLADIQARFPGKPMAVVVFACEYRPASETTHRRHADLTFARTGIARVGTQPPRYVSAFRGFFPEIADDIFGIAVSPARYVAYLAVQLTGSAAGASLMRPRGGDNGRAFWVPVHKLFPGDECLNGLMLGVTFRATHTNEKIFRAHKMLADNGLGPAPPTTPPYRFTNDLADLSTDPDLGPGWVIPTVHPHLVAEAKTPAGKDVTYAVPKKPGNWATVDLWAITGSQSGPEYLHARTEVLGDGSRRDLNQFNTDPVTGSVLPVDARVRKGGYNALNYVDFTADGSVSVACPQVQGVSGVAAAALPAYSLVAAPDFFPSCGQRDLVEWVESNDVPQKLKDQVWASNSPAPLSDQRFPANIQMPNSPFAGDDKSVTAIVGLPIPPAHSPIPGSPGALRHSHLTDDAAGVFFPGWDVSLDTNSNNVKHLAAYGLGSPFPEDSKLCAALSTFWPAVAPDVTRTMDTAPQANLSGTVAPLTDAEIGSVGGLPWDGVPGPQEIVVAGQPVVEYNSFVHADYVTNALNDRFSIRLLSKVDFREYTSRILAMIYGYLALGVERTSAAENPALDDLSAERKTWVVLSFATITAGDPELTKAGMDTGTSPAGPIYRASAFLAAPVTTPNDFHKRHMPIQGRIELILAPGNPQPVGPLVLLKKSAQMNWRRGEVIVAITAADRGASVILIERDAFPRHAPGESLHPGVQPLLRQLGVEREVLNAGFIRHLGHVVHWGGEDRLQPFGEDAEGPWLGFQAWRPTLDALLLERARGLGVRILQPCPVTGPLFRDGKIAGVETASGTVRTEVVVDATGRWRALSRWLGLGWQQRGPTRLAWYGYASGPAAERLDTPYLRADACGWTWVARVRPRTCAWTRLNFDNAKPAAGWLPTELAGMEPEGPVRGANVTWQVAARPAGPGYFLAGDATAILDPASSHGVLKALMSGIYAGHLAANVARGAAPEGAAANHYSDWVREWFDRDVARLDELYGQLPDSTVVDATAEPLGGFPPFISEDRP